MDSGRLEAVPQTAVHLDTVRALHQTVVSLRTALEVSKLELKELKDKYKKHSECTDYEDVIEKLTLENHILRRKIIDSGYTFEEKDFNVSTQNINLEVTYSPRQSSRSDKYTDVTKSDVIIETATSEVNIQSDLVEHDSTPSVEPQTSADDEQTESGDQEPDFVRTEDTPRDENVNEPISEVSVSKQEAKSNSHQPSFKTKLELLSKFDVRIKVRTLKDGAVVSSTTSETESTIGEKVPEGSGKESSQSCYFEESREHFNDSRDIEGDIVVKTYSTENIKMAVPSENENAKSKNEKFDIQVRITSEENLVLKDVNEKSKRKDTMNLDVDDLSLRSLSEGDNSVFSEGGTTPIGPTGAEPGSQDDRRFDQENTSGNESEEVDDIELIFTTDESKDMSNLQEDLVSIKESDWGPSPTPTTQSTPVLIKFHTLDPDLQPRGETKHNFGNENQENTNLRSVIAESALKVKRVSLPSDKEFNKVGFNSKSLDLQGRPGILKSCSNKSEIMLYRRSPNTSTRRLNSVDSLSCDYTRGLSFDNTKSSSFELGSSMDILNRDESLDNFHKNAHLGHRFSVFAERDMSKCGVSEEDLAAANLNFRRNTCPNPFQYRPPPSRTYTRTPPAPLKATLAAPGRPRPILRTESYVRRDNGAQTEVSALPNRWSSEGYLAHKVGLSALPTLPTRASPAPTARRLTVADARPPPTQRRPVLLSDIGFTSMVPELSRSADPVWARGGCACCAAHTQQVSNTSATKLLSRGSSYRSPCMSIDRSSEWIPRASGAFKEQMAWRASLPDVRGDDTDDLLDEAELFLRRSIDNLRSTTTESPLGSAGGALSRPYLPTEPRQLRLGHSVKVITPQGRIAVGRVRYVGLAGGGGGKAESCVAVGAVFPLAAYPWLPLNDGTWRGRRYFHAPPRATALFVPFAKVVMAWEQ